MVTNRGGPKCMDVGAAAPIGIWKRPLGYMVWPNPPTPKKGPHPHNPPRTRKTPSTVTWIVPALSLTLNVGSHFLVLPLRDFHSDLRHNFLARFDDAGHSSLLLPLLLSTSLFPSLWLSLKKMDMTTRCQFSVLVLSSFAGHDDRPPHSDLSLLFSIWIWPFQSTTTFFYNLHKLRNR